MDQVPLTFPPFCITAIRLWLRQRRLRAWGKAGSRQSRSSGFSSSRRPGVR